MSFFDQPHPGRNNSTNTNTDPRAKVWRGQKLATFQDPTYKQKARQVQDAAAASNSRTTGGSKNVKAVDAEPRDHLPSNLRSSDNIVKAGASSWDASYPNTGDQAGASSEDHVLGTLKNSGNQPSGPTNFARNAPPGLENQPLASSSKTMGQVTTPNVEGHTPPHLRRQGTTTAENVALTTTPTKRGGRAQPAMNAGLVSKSAKISSKFPCSYMDCTRGFTSKTDKDNHKEEEHDYCRLCDEDFDDFDGLLQHKIESEAHICCCVCSMDFRSEGGRDRHQRQMHFTQQECKCVGCGLVFDKGSALVNHIYQNQCRGNKDRITKIVDEETLRNNRAAGALHLNLLSKLPKFGNAEQLTGSIQLRGEDDDSSVGGVRLEQHLLDDQEALGESNESSPKDVKEDREAEIDLIDLSSVRSSTPMNKVRSEFPTLKEAAAMKGKEKDNAMIQDISSLGLSDSGPSSTWAMQLFPGAKSSLKAGKGTGVTMTDYRQAIIAGENGEKTLIATDWDHLMFERDGADGAYHCPFKGCELSTFNVDTLKGHLTSGYHQGTDHRCVKCLKTFKSPPALVAHMESNSERCGIKDTEHFGQMLSVVSGGFLGVKGRHADGSVKIGALDTNELEEQARAYRRVQAYEDPDYDWSL